jgi:hypothetical protein
MNKLGTRTYIALGTIVTALVAFASPAFAVVDPSADTVSFLSDQVDVLYPMLLALAAAPIALYLLRWGIHKVLAFIKSGGRRSVV